MFSLDILITIGWFLLAGGVSFALTGFLRRYALNKNLLDVPSGRSSHRIPTPRGGGFGIVVTFLTGLSILAGLGYLKLSFSLSLFGAGGLVAIIGFIDDHRHIAARWRLLIHFISAGWALYWLGGLPPLPMFGYIVNMGILGHGLAAVYLVWLLNLYNFMDGIDGIASIQAVTVCLGGTMLYGLSSRGDSEWLLPMLLLVAVTGFLVWNFPKAKIFMGDVGSGFIGMILGILSIQAASVTPELFWGWVILLGSFAVDATVTLIRRVIRGQTFFVAHRSHAYQYASRKYNTHSLVSVVYGLINLFWLLPIAALVVLGRLDGAFGVIIAYIPLIYLVIRFKAGAAELQDA